MSGVGEGGREKVEITVLEQQLKKLKDLITVTECNYFVNLNNMKVTVELSYQTLEIVKWMGDIG